MLIKTPLLHQSSGPRVFLSLSLSLSFRLFLWSTEALWVHFPSWASKTFSRRRSAPSPHREGAWCLREQSKPLPGALLTFCVNQGISASLSPLPSYRRLWTTRFQSIKGPQHPFFTLICDPRHGAPVRVQPRCGWALPAQQPDLWTGRRGTGKVMVRTEEGGGGARRAKKVEGRDCGRSLRAGWTWASYSPEP